LMDINPELKLTRVQNFISRARFWNSFWRIWLCISCIDSVTPKLNLIVQLNAKE
jgi:tRNA A37 threonylcarbamoyladenosine dehydratase